MPCFNSRGYGNEDERNITRKTKSMYNGILQPENLPKHKLQQLQLRTQEPLYDS